MKFLLLSQSGDGLALARKLLDNGHEVAAWIMDRNAKQNYDGLVKKLSRWEDFLDPSTVVFFDTTGGGRNADKLRARGHHILLGSTFADELEHDRNLAFSLMEEVGIKVPQTVEFVDWATAKEFVKKEGGRWAFKPSGELGKRGDKLGVSSYMPKDEEDLVGMLEYFESVSKSITPEFVLQKFVEGVAISTEGWFNGEEFMHPFNHTIERKQLMDHNLGPSGGCSGNCVWAISRPNHIVEQGIKLMEPTLRQFNYVGPIDLNTIVNNEGVWALEFTPRFGYDAICAFLELYQGDLGELFAKLARGDKPKEMVMKSGFGAALRISTPPYPSEEFRPKPGLPINGFTREDRDHVFFYEVRLNEKDQLVTSGSGGAVAAVTAHGESIWSSMTKAQQMAEAAKVPDKQYRLDLIEELNRDYDAFNRVVQQGAHV